MRLSEENLLVVEKMGATNYGPSQVCMYLQLDKNKFQAEFQNEDSALRTAYERGKLKADFDISSKLLENASAGNITAAQIYENIREKKETEAKIRKYFMLDD